MDKFEAFLRFLLSYPGWARVLIVLGLAIAVFTLLLAPRSAAGTKSKEAASVNGEEPDWLIIDGIQLFGSYKEAQVKLHVNVNRTEFVYPTLDGVEWLGVGPTMAAQQFPLPRPGRNGYEIQMRMDMRDRGETLDFRSVERMFVKKVPFEGEYTLHSVEEGVRAAGINAAARFRIDKDPNRRGT